MKICTKCGAEAFDNATICSECGGFVGASKSTPVQEQSVQKEPSVKQKTVTQQSSSGHQSAPQKQAPVVQQVATAQQPVIQQVRSDRKICSRCGAEVFNNAQFCTNCGYSMGNVSAPPHATQYQQQAMEIRQIPSYQEAPYQQPTNIPQLRSFCSKCGTEVINGAAVCTTCGCRVEQAPAVTQYQQQKQGFQYRPSPQQVSNVQQQPSYQTRGYEKKESGVPLILNFIGSMLAAISVFLWLLGIMDSYISVGTYSVWFYVGDQVLAGFVCALAAFAMGVTSLIVSLVQKSKKEYVFYAIERIVIGIAMALPQLIMGSF